MIPFSQSTIQPTKLGQRWIFRIIVVVLCNFDPSTLFELAITHLDTFFDHKTIQLQHKKCHIDITT